MAAAAALTDYTENNFIDTFMRGQTFTMPATQYIGLVTTASSDSACGTEVSGGSYARVAVTSSMTNWDGTQGGHVTIASNGTSGQTSNNIAITFPAPTANWGSIVGVASYDASTSGNCLWYTALTTSKTVNNGDAAPSFAIGALTFTIDN